MKVFRSLSFALVGFVAAPAVMAVEVVDLKKEFEYDGSYNDSDGMDKVIEILRSRPNVKYAKLLKHG